MDSKHFLNKMDTENTNSSLQTERDKINEQLDELRRQNQQEHEPNGNSHLRFGHLLGLLGIGGALLLGGTACKPKTETTCYFIYIPESTKNEIEKTIEDSAQYSETVKQESQQDTPDSNEEQKDSNENQKE